MATADNKAAICTKCRASGQGTSSSAPSYFSPEIAARYHSAMYRPASTRRHFILSSAAGLSSIARAASPRIIDTHIHLYDPSRPQGVPWPSKTDPVLYRPVLPDAYAALVRPLGVTGAIVVEASPWVEDNQWVLDLAARHPIIVGHVGHLEPGAETFRAQLARFSKNPLFRGIRLGSAAIDSGISHPAFIEDLQRLADAGLMIDAIGASSMIRSLLTLTEKIRRLRIAIDHMPSEPGGWRELRNDLRELAKSPQVYSKVSGVLKKVDGRVPEDLGPYKESLDEIWEMFGAGRVMYGSNWPVSDRLAPYNVALGIMKQYLAAKDSAASDLYFWRNSKACYRWIERKVR